MKNDDGKKRKLAVFEPTPKIKEWMESKKVQGYNVSALIRNILENAIKLEEGERR